jgi:hypothetical protein
VIAGSRITTSCTPGATCARVDWHSKGVIEALCRESRAAESGALEELKVRFTTTVTDPDSDRSTSRFDELAYTAELRRLLIDRQAVAEEELVAGGKARVDNVSEALEDRIRTGQLEATEAEEDGSIRMDITLTGGS